MAKNLVIVESPSKSKTIEKYLGKEFKVVSSKGHIRDLATSGKFGLGVDVENDFEGLQTMRNIGKNMAWLIKCINAGKEVGIETPIADSGKRTNFIR